MDFNTFIEWVPLCVIFLFAVAVALIACAYLVTTDWFERRWEARLKAMKEERRWTG